MKLRSLHVENFRGLRHASIDDAAEAVVIAGPNGSGKSCLLDAIRLFKSAYGSYNESGQDEVQLWTNEFQLSWNGRRGDLRGAIRDRSKSATIHGRIRVTETEKAFMLGPGRWNVESKLREAWDNGMWREKLPGREILDALCAKLGGNIDGKRLRTAIVGAMARESYQPDEMAEIIRSIDE